MKGPQEASVASPWGPKQDMERKVSIPQEMARVMRIQPWKPSAQGDHSSFQHIHQPIHLPNFSTVEILQTLNLGSAQPFVFSALYTLNMGGENHPAVQISTIMKTSLQPQFLQT